MTYKICPDCGASTPKPVTEFYRNRSNKDGYSVYCKKHQNQRNARSRRSNPDPMRSAVKKWKAKNPDKVRAQKKRRAKRPAGKKERQRLAKRRREAGGVLSAYDWGIVLETFGGMCAYCGTTEGLTQDHYIPIAAGGRTELGNITPACRRCNSAKNSHMAIDFLIEYGVSEAEALAITTRTEEILQSFNQEVPF